VIRLASLLAALYLFWILMSGFFTPFLLAAGLGSVLFVAWLAHRMNLIDREGHPLHLTWSCYRDPGIACGRCDSCLLRLRGFREAGVEDPIPYRPASPREAG